MLTVILVILSVVLITLIVLQERDSGMSGLLGGSGGGAYQTRRGLEKAIYWATLVTGFLFVACAVANLII